MFKKLILILAVLSSIGLKAQAPTNDNCDNADWIKIGYKGFAFGTFISQRHNIEFATKEKAELCSNELENNGNCDKTVWFKFYIATTRDISIQLSQEDSAIPQIFGGFNLYKVKDCNYTMADLSQAITPINKFGKSGNACLEYGWYYIQVGFKHLAKGEIWIELTSQASQLNSIDQYNSAYDLGQVKDQQKNASLNFSCASVEFEEAQFIGDTTIDKSIFFKFRIPPNTIHTRLTVSANTKRLGYRIFIDRLNPDSINGGKSYIWLKKPSNGVLINNYCDNINSIEQTYYVQLICEGYLNPLINISIENLTAIEDKWNTQNTDDIIYTNNNFTRNKKHKYNCDGQLKKHGCKTVLKDYYVGKISYFPGDTTYDTLDVAGYTIIHSNQAGILKTYMQSIYGYKMRMQYMIFEGDITQGCNLTLKKTAYVDDFSFCIDASTYTLVTLSSIGNANIISTHNITQVPSNLNTKYYYPKAPFYQGVLTKNGNTNLTSPIVHFRQKDTTFTIDTLTRSGFFIFREFHLAEKSSFTLYEAYNMYVSTYLLKGRVSKGDAQLIPFLKYPWNGSSIISNCVEFDSGYYTLVSFISSKYANDICMPPQSKTEVAIPSLCRSDTANYPRSAIKVNNLSNVLSNSTALKNLDYVYKLKFCTDCNTQSQRPALPDYRKNTINAETKFTYYVFYVGQNVEFRSNLFSNSYELYRGNCLVNPNLVLDTGNIVSLCPGGNVYCNLEGNQYYTFVIFNAYSGIENSLYFTPHVTSPNEYALSAENLGHFSSNGTKNALPRPITCHTNGYPIDPCSYEYGYRNCIYSYDSSTIPWKDSLNLKRFYGRKNLWYTFTAENSSNIRITLNGQTPLERVRKFSVFRYNGPYEENFNMMKFTGFDSTEKSMEWICTNNRKYTNIDTREIYADFKNSGCNKNRYFVLLEDDFYNNDPAHYNYILSVTYTLTAFTSEGDFCSNPVTTTISSYGTSTLSTNNTCHTYGQSPNETPYRPDYKTTWFKFSVTGIAKCDIGIRNTNSAGLVKYIVYGGECGSLTKITDINDINAYITLSCMGKGDYYIQAICKKQSNGLVGFELKVLNPASTKCKPYDFDEPLSQFKIIGGCNGDSIRFINYSSFGTTTTYTWKINGTYFSNKKEPILDIDDPLVLKTSNNISLLVTNTNKGTSNTFNLEFKPDTNTYYFKAEGPLSASCIDTAVLKVNTNFPDKINYKWMWVDNIVSLKSPYLLTHHSSDRTFSVYGESDNCRFFDTIRIKGIPTDVYKDTAICADDPKLVLKNLGENYLYMNNIQIKSDSFVITIPGVYRMYYNYRGCGISEEMEVFLDSSHSTLSLFDTISVCNKDSIAINYKLYPLKNAIWNNGSKGSTIKIGQSGDYTLQGAINPCKDLIQHFNVTFRTRTMELLRDSTFCFNDTFDFTELGSDFEIIDKDPITPPYIVKNNFKARLKVITDDCEIEDSAYMTVYKPINLSQNLLYCDTNLNVGIELNSGTAKSYQWLGRSDTTPVIQVNAFGVYKVERTQFGSCKDTMQFKVISDCPFNIFMPTAFSPTNDNINEVFSPVISGTYRSYQLTIFNRWGEILLITENKGWNGYYKGESAMQDVYGYLLTVVDSKGRKYFLNGSFTLLR